MDGRLHHGEEQDEELPRVLAQYDLEVPDYDREFVARVAKGLGAGALHPAWWRIAVVSWWSGCSARKLGETMACQRAADWRAGCTWFREGQQERPSLRLCTYHLASGRARLEAFDRLGGPRRPSHFCSSCACSSCGSTTGTWQTKLRQT